MDRKLQNDSCFHVYIYILCTCVDDIYVYINICDNNSETNVFF